VVQIFDVLGKGAHGALPVFHELGGDVPIGVNAHADDVIVYPIPCQSVEDKLIAFAVAAPPDG
jgi:hypothetical protein